MSKKMRYFKVFSEYRSRIIGQIEVPQSDQLCGANINEAYSDQKTYWKREPPLQPITVTYLLKKQSKLTDYLSVMQGHSHYGIVLSDAMIAFIKEYNVTDVWLTPVFLSKINMPLITNYALFVIKNSIIDSIDFDNSEFYVKSILANDHFRKEATIHSMGDIKKLEDEKENWHHKLHYQKLALKKDFTYDIFRIGHNLGGYVVSERLKIAIEENGFTGIQFELDKSIEVIQNNR